MTKSFSKEHVISPCLPVIEETAAPEHVNTRLLAGRGPWWHMPAACAGSTESGTAESRAKPWSELLDTVIWATAGPGWLALAYTLQLVSNCNTLKGTAKQSVLTYLPTKRRWTLCCVTKLLPQAGLTASKSVQLHLCSTWSQFGKCDVRGPRGNRQEGGEMRYVFPAPPNPKWYFKVSLKCWISCNLFQI